MLPEVFVVVALVCAGLTLNGYRPVRRQRFVLVQSFLAAWIVSELPAHVLALYVLVGGAMVSLGALGSSLGQLALVILALAALGLLGFVRPARASRAILEDALRSGLGEGYESALPKDSLGPGWLFYLLPFLRIYPGVSQHLNVRYAEGAGSRHLLDVYTPAAGALPNDAKAAEDKAEDSPRAPVVLQIHGGGWFTGHKRQQALPLLFHLAARGFVCVSINYRLSPRATWPEHLIDVKLALAWIRAHIAEYGGDPNYVMVTGGSAGGHLAAMTALTPNDPRYQPGFAEVDTRVRACVPFYGVYDFTDRHGHQLTHTLRNLIGAWVLKRRYDREPEAFLEASPMSYIGPHAPPFCVIQGSVDSIVSVQEAREFARMLRDQSKAEVVFAELPGAHHAFEILHSIRTASTTWAVTRFLEHVRARDSANAATGASSSATTTQRAELSA